MITLDDGSVWCHCGALMGRSDHCPCCGCEEYEGTCDHECPDPQAEEIYHADHGELFDPDAADQPQ